jgi:hypothetical protein
MVVPGIFDTEATSKIGLVGLDDEFRSIGAADWHVGVAFDGRRVEELKDRVDG